jgi:HK97 family phage prohead protease
MSGLVIPYDTPAVIGGLAWYTQFSRGAFAASILAGGIELRVNHRADLVLASQARRTLRFADGPHGLCFGATVTDPDLADELVDLDARGLLHGMSVGLDDQHVSARSGAVGRIVEACWLCEISLVVDPERPGFVTTWVRVDVARAACLVTRCETNSVSTTAKW